MTQHGSRPTPKAATRPTSLPVRARTPTSGWARAFMTFAGLVLLFLAQLANYSDAYLFAARGKVFFRLPGEVLREYTYFPVWFVLLGVPLALVLIGLCFRTFRQALAAPWRNTRIAAPLLAVLVFLAVSLVPWEPGNLKPEDSGTRMVFFVVLAGGGLALLLAGVQRELKFLDAAVKGFYQWLMALPRLSFLAMTAGFTFIAANLVSFFVFEHLPHIQDSISQVFQARIFATGRLFLPAPHFPDFFDYTHIINIPAQTGHPASGFNIANWPGPVGRWYSQYPFLHSLILTLGALVGMPWIVNPLLGALTIPAIYFLGREVYDERTGRLGAALSCITPFIFNMSAEFMNHSSALLFTTLFVLFYFRTLREGKWRQALAAGVCMGLMADVRVFTAFAIALPFAGYGLYLVIRGAGKGGQGRGFYLSRFAVMVLAAAGVSSLLLVYNWLTNGHPMLFGYVVKWGKGHEIGFGRSGWGDEHTPLRGLVNTGHDLNLLNKFLFEWPLPALIPMGILFASGTRDRRDWLLAGVYLSLVGAYFFYWFHNVCFGPRFVFESAACLVLLTVRGGQVLPALLRRTFALQTGDESVNRFLGRALPVVLLLMLVGLPPLFKSYRAYGWVDATLIQNVKRNGLHNALVFCFHYGNGFSANRLDLTGDVVYAKDYGMLNAALTVAYPGRNCYYANRDTLRLLEDIEYPRSRLKRALDEMSYVLPDTAIARYRTVLWPIRDVPPEAHDPALLESRLVDFREVSRELFTGRHTLEDYLPAVACWILKDGREHLTIFSYMDDLESFVASGYKFTLLYVTTDGTGAIYDIRSATGRESVVPDKAGTIPIR